MIAPETMPPAEAEAYQAGYAAAEEKTKAELAALRQAVGPDGAAFVQSLVDECAREIVRRKAAEALCDQGFPSIRAVEAAYPDAFWHIGKGQLTAEEPLYGASIEIAGRFMWFGESDNSADDAMRKALFAAQSGTPAIQTSTPEQGLISDIARVSSAIGFQSGEPAMEIAGQIVSALAASPELIDRFIAEGSELFLTGALNAENGCLPWRARNGSIVSPSQFRQHARIQQ